MLLAAESCTTTLRLGLLLLLQLLLRCGLLCRNHRRLLCLRQVRRSHDKDAPCKEMHHRKTLRWLQRSMQEQHNTKKEQRSERAREQGQGTQPVPRKGGPSKARASTRPNLP